MKIQIITTTYSEVENIDLVAGQLICCTDTKHAFFDLDDELRMPLNCVRQLSNKQEIMDIEIPEENTIYVATTTKNMFRYYKSIGWLTVFDYEAVSDIFIKSEELIPFTIENNGVKYAPTTLARYVFMNDGSTLQSNIDTLLKRGAKVALKSSIQEVQFRYKGQTELDIPFPTTDYDLTKFPFILLIDDKRIKQDEYACSRTQVILSNDLKSTITSNSIATFIFVYAQTLANSDLDCNSINGVRIFIGNRDLALDLRQDKDLMINTYYKELKQWNDTDQEWQVILSDRRRLIKYDENRVIFNQPRTYVDIGKVFNSNKDKLLVFKDGVLLVEGTDYVVSADDTFIKPSQNGKTWITNDSMEFYFLIFRNIPNISTNEFDDEEYIGEIVSIKSELDDLRSTVSTLKNEINTLKGN